MQPATRPQHGVHATVLERPAVDALVTDPGGTYVDATFGRGGHARCILERLSASGRLLALDRDPQARDAAHALTDTRFRFVQAAFSGIDAVLREQGMEQVNGLLADLGVSSPQIDDPARGFSFRGDGPLDMRMDPGSGMSAQQWLAQVDAATLRGVLRDYGDERFAASIAKAVVARREAGQPLRRTAELAALVADAIPLRSRRDPGQHPATRTFQAIRIFINQELEEVALMLERIVPRLVTGGRLAVISFHSLEDRIVKRFIDAHAHPERAFGRLPLRAVDLPQPTLQALPRIDPDAAELQANPRARSAHLRVAARTAVPLTRER